MALHDALDSMRCLSREGSACMWASFLVEGWNETALRCMMRFPNEVMILMDAGPYFDSEPFCDLKELVLKSPSALCANRG
jgi:hypothetical protein